MLQQKTNYRLVHKITPPQVSSHKAQILNIFQEKFDQYKFQQNGPIYNQQGQITRRSLLGKPESFMIMQKQRQSFKGADNMESTPSVFKYHMQSRTLLSKRNTRQPTITKDQIQHFILQQTKVRETKLNQSRRSSSMNIFERHQLERDYSCLIRFKQQDRQWNKMKSTLSRQTSSLSESTLIAKQKNDTVEIDEQKINQSWENDLRRASVKSVQLSKSIQSNTIAEVQNHKSQLLKNKNEKSLLQIQGISKANIEYNDATDIQQTDLSANRYLGQSHVSISNWNKKWLSRKGLQNIPSYLEQWAQ